MKNLKTLLAALSLLFIAQIARGMELPANATISADEQKFNELLAQAEFEEDGCGDVAPIFAKMKELLSHNKNMLTDEAAFDSAARRIIYCHHREQEYTEWLDFLVFILENADQGKNGSMLARLLHFAVHKQMIGAAKILIEHGANINCIEDERTPLMCAVSYANLAMVKMVLNTNAPGATQIVALPPEIIGKLYLGLLPSGLLNSFFQTYSNRLDLTILDNQGRTALAIAQQQLNNIETLFPSVGSHSWENEIKNADKEIIRLLENGMKELKK